jgi:fatty acid-binding protein DegV
LTVEEIEEYMIEANKKRLVALIVPDLKFLIRGGRIKKIAGAVATLLNFKIVISLDTDGLNFYGKVIKTSQLPGKIKELFDEKIDFEHKKVKRVCFASSEFHDKKYDFEGLKEDLMKYFGFKDVGKATMPGVVMVHTGPNYFAVGIEIE